MNSGYVLLLKGMPNELSQMTEGAINKPVHD
jgi:hypothetical protein